MSNNGASSLTIVAWDGGDSPSIVGTIAVDEQPLGIDLREDGDNIAIVSTSMSNDSVTVTILDAGGGLVSSDTQAAPVGCDQPSYAIWLPDEENVAVISCSGSDAYALVNP